MRESLFFFVYPINNAKNNMPLLGQQYNSSRLSILPWTFTCFRITLALNSRHYRFMVYKYLCDRIRVYLFLPIKWILCVFISHFAMQCLVASGSKRCIWHCFKLRFCAISYVSIVIILSLSIPLYLSHSLSVFSFLSICLRHSLGI